MRSKRQRSKQLWFAFGGRGGARKGAGRKPKGERPGVSHAMRARFRGDSFPVHVAMKVLRGIPNLRWRRVFHEVRAALHAHEPELGMRVCHYSVQSNHLHLVVEASGKEGLSRGMQGLAVRIARAINRSVDRAGRVFADRYFSRILKTPREVRNVLVYVLENARKHGAVFFGVDPCSSAPFVVPPAGGMAGKREEEKGSGPPEGGTTNGNGWLPGFETAEKFQGQPAGWHSPIARARTWLLRAGWLRHGPIVLGAIAPRA